MRCPETRQRLAYLELSVVEKFNRDIALGKVSNRAGVKISEPIEGGLVREDGSFFYPIRFQIPVLLVDEAIAL